jgi:hypothetical protein
VYNLPIMFQPGEGRVYGGGLDWAGEIIAPFRLPVDTSHHQNGTAAGQVGGRQHTVDHFGAAI